MPESNVIVPAPTSITEVAQAIEDTITNSDLNGFIATVAGYQDFLRAISEDGEEVGKLPAVFVTYLGGPFKELTSKKHRHDANFRLFVLGQNFRGDEARTETDIGVFSLVQSLLILFSNNKMGIDGLLKPMEPSGVESLFTEKLIARGISSYVIDFQCRFIIDVREEDFVKNMTKIGFDFILQEPTSGNDSDYQAEIDTPQS